MPATPSQNFAFLESHDSRLVQLGALAERYFAEDPSTTLFKLRQLAELLARLVAARTAQYKGPDETFSDLLRRLKLERLLPRAAADLFHQLRVIGNAAAHEVAGTHGEALSGLKIARELAVWFHRTFGADPKFSAGPFVPPRAPLDPSAALTAEIERLRAVADQAKTEAERAQAAAGMHEEALLSAKDRAQREAAERVAWEQLALTTDEELRRVSEQLAALQASAKQQPKAVEAAIERAAAVALSIDLDEASTRALIDQQLRDVGWEADTQALRFSTGARPAKGRNLAISEWPTASGPADYALFAGLELVGVVEAKRRNRNVMEVLPQAERYAQGIALHGATLADGAPWSGFQAPFAFSTNGRPYLKQLETASGIWRRDLRRAKNPAAVLTGWPKPEDLLERLQVNVDEAHASLADRGFDFGFPLRAYQRRAIEIVEHELAQERRNLLVAMATGTGKTKLAIAMLYRLISVKRFRRVCFVVDRSALGEQTRREFTTTKVVSGKAFGDLFNLKGLEDVRPDPETRVHICTIQGLVKRVLYAEEPGEAPSVGEYDLMLVDECHRGYLLDREMSDVELSFRDQQDYISTYRRVLEHFDAVKIGLTATPAIHTAEIFGPPIFTYSYREAVIDGFLVDHEPPIRIGTELSLGGIHFVREQEVEYVHATSGEVRKEILPDNIDFEVDEFNKAVITEPFNRAVAEELARHIDPSLPGKTLVFAVSDAHADIVVKALRDAFRQAYGEIEDSVIRKVTGRVDQVGKLILSYRNDAQPQIAVTVDLLTTGIDVPRITNLVFLRRVNSRILYEQMLGRATRLCPEIGKENFRIFDAVDLYSRLQSLTDMQPVAANPKLTLTKLFDELAEARDETWRVQLRDQIIVRLRLRLGKLSAEARAQFELLTGESPEATLRRVQHTDPATLSEWVRARRQLGVILDWGAEGGTPIYVPISQHPDEVISVTRGYGNAERPEDFLDQFTSFVRDNINTIAALKLVVQRPQELTREELRKLRIELDARGFTDAKIRRAWTDAKNEDIAASIIGYIRQAALGSPLLPFEDRVKQALARVMQAGRYTDLQKKWLRRIGEQIERELVVDRSTLDEQPFKADGGFRVIDKRFNGQLTKVLADINQELWRDAS
jgi:type I restriction enzyme R subunit